MRVYYNRNNIVVRSAKMSDVDGMKNRLRESDIKEIWASHHYTPEQALKKCVDTVFAATIENGRPIGLFGINATELLGKKATVFMLATNDLEKIEMRFLRNCRQFIDYMLEYYPYLENWVHANNKKSIAWLKFLGATVEDAKPYGIENEQFHHFYFTKE